MNNIMGHWKKKFDRKNEKQLALMNQQVIELHKSGKFDQALELASKTYDFALQHLENKHQEVAKCLTTQAFLYYELGNYSKAEMLYMQAMEIIRKVSGETHDGLATIQNNLALLYLKLGKYDKAETLYVQALEIRRNVSGKRNLKLYFLLNNLGLWFMEMGKIPPDDPTYTHAMEIKYRDYLDLSYSLSGLAELYRETGKYSKAEPLYLEALEIRRKGLGDKHPDIANILNNLAVLYNEMGRYNKAESMYQQALDIRRRVHGENHHDVANTLANLAQLYDLMGNYSRAEPLLKQALEIRRNVLGGNHPDVVQSLFNLAELYNSIGTYSRSEPLYQQALEIERKTLGEDHPHFANCLSGLAKFYIYMGNYSKAEPILQQALEIRRKVLGEKHPDYATSLNNLAYLYDSMGNSMMAIPLFVQALLIKRETLGEKHPDVATGLNNLAGLNRDIGKYAEAESLLRQALDITQRAFNEEHPEVALILNNLAELYKAMGKYNEAVPLCQQALKIRRKAFGEEHPEVAQSLNNLAVLYIALDRQAEGLVLMEQANVIDDMIIGQVFSISSESQRMAYLQTIRGRFDGFLSLFLLNLSNSQTFVQTGLDLVMRRKSIGFEALAAQRDAVYGERYPQLQQMLKELTSLKMQIAKKTLAGQEKSESLEAHRKQLSEWNTLQEKLEAELASHIPEIKLEQKLRAADRAAVARALTPGSALIEFVRFNNFDFKAVPARGEPQWKPAHYIVFVLPAGEPDNIRMIDLGEVDPIDKMINGFRASITGEVESRHLMPEVDRVTPMSDGKELRAAVFDPLIAFLNRGCKHLFLAPDGDLTRLPFEALPTSGGNYLIDEYHFSYLSVGRDVLRFGTASGSQPAAPLVIADPNFNLGRVSESTDNEMMPGRQARDLDRSSLHFGSLPGTRVEGECISTLLSVQPLLDDMVLETRLKECKSPKILHMATHGFFLHDQKPTEHRLGFGTVGGVGDRLSGQGLENPLLRSGLALAGANTWLNKKELPEEAEDAILNGEDVSGLNLLATELVVLSACDTGLGEVKIGEGVFGLRRAFVLAGARTLVMSLWKVPDKQTQELMVDFYRYILSGKSRAESLREAQLAIKEKYPDPYYWGAFICQGDPAPLP